MGTLLAPIGLFTVQNPLGNTELKGLITFVLFGVGAVYLASNTLFTRDGAPIDKGA